MTAHLFALRPGASNFHIHRGPTFGHGPTDETYQFIDDEDHVEILKDKTAPDGRPMFRWLSVEELDETLGAADEAVAAIKAGEYDEYLDLLLVAERKEYGNRVSVVDAIAERDREIEAERAQAGDTAPDVTPADVQP
jgi:hypothetical protein